MYIYYKNKNKYIQNKNGILLLKNIIESRQPLIGLLVLFFDE